MNSCILPCSAKQGMISLVFIFIILSPPECAAQLSPNTNPNDDNGDPLAYARFSPSMAVIVAILVAALFFMGFLSIYIRNCADSGNSGSVRPLPGMGRSRRAARGLDASVIETFPTMVYSEVKHHKIGKGALECAVCLSEFEDHETLRLIPKCDHVFHPECIDEWLGLHTTCPVCRANLVPQPGEPVAKPIDFTSAESDIEAQHDTVNSEPEDEPRLNANAVVGAPAAAEVIDVNKTPNGNRARGSRSSRTRRFPRSHSTGHSLVQPGENTERFTLRLPVEIRKQVINRQLNRATSMMILPREGSSRRGYRTGGEGSSRRGYRAGGEGSSRGRYIRWYSFSNRLGKSDRWVLSMTPPFISRASSIRSPRVAVNSSEGTSAPPAVAESIRPPV